MNQRGLDFEGLAEHLRQQAAGLLHIWLPGGRIQGDEYQCSDLTGGNGKSLLFNVEKGVGQDFATNESFGDMIELYARIQQMTLGDAAKALAEEHQYDLYKGRGNGSVPGPATQPASAKWTPPVPPADVERAPTVRAKIQDAWMETDNITWYETPDGAPLIFTARFDYTREGKPGKDVIPYRWDPEKGRWRQGAWKHSRPLLGLPGLSAEPDKPVMIVEGEKDWAAAVRLCGGIYTPVTWAGGPPPGRRRTGAP